MGEGEWYYCLDHHTVEPYEGCPSASRLGPYASPDEAARGLERVADRNEQWDNDPRFNDDVDDEPSERDQRDAGRWPELGS